MFKNFSGRTNNILNQISLNFLYKGASILITLFFVPLSIKFLGKDNYGIWLTLFSFIAFFNFFNFGLGHGLRNYLTKAIANKNYYLARQYISTTYISVFTIGSILTIVFLVSFDFINWQNIFKVSANELDNFLILIKIVAISFFINLGLKLIEIIFFASLKPSIPGILYLINNIFSLVTIYLLMVLKKESLIYYGSTIIGIQLLVLLFTNFLMFRSSYKHLRPSFFYFNKSLLKELFSLGGNFFLIQIAAVILYSSDNLIITQLFTPGDVTIYNVAYKYFGIFTMGASLILVPLWSAITHAQSMSDFNWIKSIIKKSLILVSGLSLVVILFFFISNFVYTLWVGNNIKIPNLLSLIMAFYAISSMFLQIFSMYLNGIGKIKLQVIIAISVAILNIPLSILFARYLNMGVAGVIMATLVCNIISLVFYPLQYKKIINQKAKGIWNE